MGQVDNKDTQIRQSFIDSNRNFRFKPFAMRIKPENKATSADLEWLLKLPITDSDSDSSSDEESVNGDGDEVDVDKDGWPHTDSETEDAPKPVKVPKASGILNVGLQVAFTKQAGLAALALCANDHILVVTDILKSKNSSTKASSAFRDAFHEQLLEGELYFTAFDAHEVALTVFKDTGLRLSRLFNLLDYPKPDARPSHIATVRGAFGSEAKFFEDRILEAFVKREFKFGRGREGSDHTLDLATEAWLAFIVGKQLRAKSALLEIVPINLMKFNDTPEILDEQVRAMSTLIMSAIAEPDRHDIKFQSADFNGGSASVYQTAYNSRIHRGEKQYLQARTADNTRFRGRVGKIDGKKATLRMLQMQGLRDQNLTGITVRGKADPTQAEARQSRIILKVLQNKKQVDREPWYHTLYPPRRRESKKAKAAEEEKQSTELDAHAIQPETQVAAHTPESTKESTSDSSEVEDVVTPAQDSYWKGWSNESQGASWDPEPDSQVTTSGAWDDVLPAAPKSKAKPKNDIPVMFESSRLNDSQLHAVKDILDFDKKVSIIKGPPGTGKTTVIAAVLSSLLAASHSHHYGYIVTQSNVGAKNIAEKLVKAGIRDWVILVANEFMHDWHDHLYTNIPEEFIFIPEGKKQAPHRRFTICTLSMLSNSHVCKRSQQVPMNILLVDEASQISMPSYNVIIQQYTKNLQKIGFIGDNHQLPPFHSDKSTDFDSVFEHTSLLAKAGILLLDKQYRMPPQIGTFISQHVYEGALHSWEGHPVQNRISCQFVDVIGSREAFDRPSSGTKNEEEADVTVQIASTLALEGLSFKIITPYDAQKNLIENNLKKMDLHWENTVYTVDSFQGNEDDYIIISSVRTLAPGFMRDLRRSNVMLTRAKKAMYICTNIPFLISAPAQDTLLSKMAKAWAELDGGIISSDSLANSIVF